MLAANPIAWEDIFKTLRSCLFGEELPSVSQIAADKRDPFRVLISTMISLRTKDEVTLSASERLFSVADTPEKMAALEEERIAELIYPAGFYSTKAKHIRTAAGILVQDYGGTVPDSLQDLLTLPGVGRKTGNLVLNLGFGIPAICVDTHVHRITNRMGFIETKTPDDTETALMEILPEQYWIELNGLLVAFGKKLCTPQSPFCSLCPFTGECPRVGVEKSR